MYIDRSDHGASVFDFSEISDFTSDPDICSFRKHLGAPYACTKPPKSKRGGMRHLNWTRNIQKRSSLVFQIYSQQMKFSI